MVTKRYDITGERPWVIVNAITLASRLSANVSFRIHGNSLLMKLEGSEAKLNQCHNIVSNYFPRSDD